MSVTDGAPVIKLCLDGARGGGFLIKRCRLRELRSQGCGPAGAPGAALPPTRFRRIPPRRPLEKAVLGEPPADTGMS